MAANVTCPTCGHKIRLTQETPGQEVRCPACLNLVPSASAPAPSLLARSPATGSAPAAAPNRTMLAEPEAMIRYTCPRCKKSLESPVSFAGQKLHCPDCNQRLQIPQPSTSPGLPPVNKTILATEQGAGPAAPPASGPQPLVITAADTARGAGKAKGAEEGADVLEVVEATPSRGSRRESCLECGADVTHLARVQTCPDCGSVFCSARCYRDHNAHAHPPQRKIRPRYVTCSSCGSTAPPYTTTQISEGGWITFAILLIFFFPLCWIGLLMTETRMKCADCGARIN